MRTRVVTDILVVAEVVSGSVVLDVVPAVSVDVALGPAVEEGNVDVDPDSA